MERRKLQRPKPDACLLALSLFFVTLFLILGFPQPAQVSQGHPAILDPVFSTGGNVITNISPLNEPKSAVKRDVEEAGKTKIQEAYGKLPLSFIQNDGQVEKKVKFYEKGSGRAAFFTKESVYLSLDGQSSSTSNNSQSALIKLTPLGANKHPKIVAEGMQEGKVNYFIGNDPKKWKTNIPTYQAVVYQEIYPGIDLKFYGNNRQMEYDIIVKPGADPSVVKFAYEGIEGLRVTDEGNLEIRVKEGTILQKKPILYQEIEGKRVKLDGKFKLLEQKDPSLGVPFPISDVIGHGEDKARVMTFAYAIEVAQYDKNHPLIIDPVLVYSTYLGGSNYEEGNGIAVDGSGNAYVTGSTVSTNFPTMNPLQPANGGVSDVFVAKFNAAGSALVYSTYLGGSGYDVGYGIAVDGSGNAYVTGRSSSRNFPTMNALQPANGSTCSLCQDAFVAKLNAAGSALEFSTYLGGSDDDSGFGIAVDGLGNAYVTGYTNSTNFPTVNAFQASCGGCDDAFVAKINATGSALVYSTYLGGSNYEQGNGIAVDASGNAYVTGETGSYNFPTANPLQSTNHSDGTCVPPRDVFVTKFNAAGSALVYSTYLGGSHCVDIGYGIAVDGSGNAYVTGTAGSSDFPVTPGAFQTSCCGAFVAKLNPSGSGLIYSTYLGHAGTFYYSDIRYGIAVDGSGNAYVTGSTSSTNFPTCPSSSSLCASTGTPIQAANGGGIDAFVAKLNAAGSALEYSTYLGGSGSYDIGKGIAVDGSGNAYVTGVTDSTDFPITPGAFQAAYGGGQDAFVAKISGDEITTTTTTSTTTTTTSTTTTTVGCNDKSKGKAKGQDKGKCKGHDNDNGKDKE